MLPTGQLPVCPNRKNDTVNNKLAFYPTTIAGNYDYPEASYAECEKDYKRTIGNYQMDWCASWPIIQNLKSVRWGKLQWSTSKDEFERAERVANSNSRWEARRRMNQWLIVMTKKNWRHYSGRDAIVWPHYGMDSHNVQRMCVPKWICGRTRGQCRGPVALSPSISIDLVPKRRNAIPYVVPICVVSSTLLFGSIRRAGIIGLDQSAATAAATCIGW